MKHLRYFPLLGFSLLCAGLQTSCIDNSYDLKDTDYTLGIETNLTLPTCSTGEIYLRNFMDLKEDGIIQYVWDEELQDSIFCVRETGRANVNPIHIDEIRIKKPQLSEIETTINLRDMINAREKVRITVNTPFGEQDVEVADQTFIYDLKDNDATYSIRNATADHISADVVSIEKVGFQESVIVTLDIHLNGFPEYIPLMHLDHMTLSYPNGLHISKCTFNGKECPIENRMITLSEEKGEPIKISEGVQLKLTIDALQAGEAFEFEADRHRVNLHGDFTLHGAFRVETSEFDTEKLSQKINSLTTEDIEAFLAGSWEGLVPVSIGVKGDAAFSEDIIIKTFSGEVTHNVGYVSPIVLDDLPDFLNDEGVVLDLDNPILLFTTKHDLPSAARTSIELSSNTCDIPVKTVDFDINPGINKYYIADKPAKALPENYTEASRVNISGSVPALIKKIPEQIDINVDPVRLHAQEMDITRDYDVDIDYEVFAPFTFGPNFNLVYGDTERDWAKDLNDLEDLDAELLELKGKADSNLPADCILTLIPIDKNGEEIKALEVNSINIRGNSKDNDIRLTIKAAPGHTFNDVLAGKNGVKQLDGVKYTARLVGADGETMKKDAAIRLYDMQVTIKGTVSYDAN